jgi:hypothetical protein
MALSVILYAMGYVTILKKQMSLVDIIIFILTTAAIVTFHGYTAIIFTLAAVPIFIYLKRPVMFALVLIIPLAWQIWVAYDAFSSGVKYVVTMPFFDLKIARNSFQDLSVSLPRLVARYATMAYIGFYGSLVIISSLVLLKKRAQLDNNKIALMCLLAILGASTAVAMQYGGESITRVFWLIAFPAAFLVVLTIKSRVIIALIVIISLVLFLPARFVNIYSWSQVPSVDLSGAKFFVEHTDRPPKILTTVSEPLFSYFNPEFITTSNEWWTWQTSIEHRHDMRWVRAIPYVVLSQQGTRSLQTSTGDDAIRSWIEAQGYDGFDLIYANNAFEIYRSLSEDPL